MEGEQLRVRIIICEKCFEHQGIDPHSELDYFQTFNDLKNQLTKHSFNWSRNQPFSYLIKMPDTKHSSKRYLNNCTNKMVQFPERGCFQIYFLNITVYSKLQTGLMPDVTTLIQVVVKLRNLYLQSPLLKQFDAIRDMELEWRCRSTPPVSLLSILNLYLPTQKDQGNCYSDQTLTNAINLLCNALKVSPGGRVLPYSCYGATERNHRIGDIYCPKPASKISSYYKVNASAIEHHRPIINRNIRTAVKEGRRKDKNQNNQTKKSNAALFDMVRLGSTKDSNPSKSLQIQWLNYKLDGKQKFNQKGWMFFGNRKYLTNDKSKQKLKRSSNVNQKAFKENNIIQDQSNRVSQHCVTRKQDQRNPKKLRKQTMIVQPSEAYSLGYINRSKSTKHFSSFNLKNGGKTDRKIYSSFRTSKNSLSIRTSHYTDYAKNSCTLSKRHSSRIQQANINQFPSYFSTSINVNPPLLQNNRAREHNSGLSVIQQTQYTLNANKQPTQESLLTNRPHENRVIRCCDCQSLIQSNKSKIRQIEFVGYLKNQIVSQGQSNGDSHKQNLSIFSKIDKKTQIIDKLSEEHNFRTDISELTPNQWHQLLQEHQLSSESNICRITKLHKLGTLKLFPSTFQPLKATSKNKSTLLLVEVVNLIIKQNTHVITRMFSNTKCINPSGIYCIWLQNKQNLLTPILVNDQFLIQQKGQLPVYAGIDHQGAIWFMLLEKAVSTVLGGYQKILSTPISDLFRIILGCPTAELTSFDVQNLPKKLPSRLLSNKLAFIYTMPNHFYQFDSVQQMAVYQLQRIAQVSYQHHCPLNTSIILQNLQQNRLSLNLQEFVNRYRAVSLIFFNQGYFFNQITLPQLKDSNSKFYSIEILNNSRKKACFIILANFNPKTLTKVTLYKHCVPRYLNEENKRYHNSKEAIIIYQYSGQISKKGSYFFETRLDQGSYICLLQSQLESHLNPVFKLYSEGKISIKTIKQHSSLENSTQGKPQNSYLIKSYRSAQQSDLEDNRLDGNEMTDLANYTLHLKYHVVGKLSGEQKSHHQLKGYQAQIPQKQKRTKHSNFIIKRKFKEDENLTPEQEIDQQLKSRKRHEKHSKIY